MSLDNGPFDKFRYKADKLHEELKSQILYLDMLMERVPGRSKYIVLRYLNMGVIDLDDVTNPDMHAIATQAIGSYAADVRAGRFPGEENVF